MAKILLVDDDELLRSLLKDALEQVGHQCAEVENVFQAKESLMGERFDVVLSDFNMPGENGLDLLAHVLKCHSRTAFIMMTASALPHMQKKALDLGADGYLTKPFPLKSLVELIKEAMVKKGRRTGRKSRRKLPTCFNLQRLPLHQLFTVKGMKIA